LSPEKAEESNEKAKELFKDGKFKEALECYSEAIKRNP
jgi:tetratricopeptide (TPR) repeat protein